MKKLILAVAVSTLSFGATAAQHGAFMGNAPSVSNQEQAVFYVDSPSVCGIAFTTDNKAEMNFDNSSVEVKFRAFNNTNLASDGHMPRVILTPSYNQNMQDTVDAYKDQYGANPLAMRFHNGRSHVSHQPETVSTWTRTTDAGLVENGDEATIETTLRAFDYQTQAGMNKMYVQIETQCF